MFLNSQFPGGNRFFKSKPCHITRPELFSRVPLQWRESAWAYHAKKIHFEILCSPGGLLDQIMEKGSALINT